MPKLNFHQLSDAGLISSRKLLSAMKIYNLGKLFDKIILALVILAGVLLVGLVVIIGSDVTLRYFFNRPFGWDKEISEYVLVYLCFLVPAWVLKEEAHVKMDMVLNAVRPRVRRMMNIITSILMTIVCAVLAWSSLTVTLDLYNTHYFTPTALQLPKYIFVAVIICGFVTLVIQLIIRTYNFIHQGEELQDRK